MTDKTEAQPEALRLAAEFEDCTRIDAIPSINDVKKSAAELRRQHAEIQQLKAEKAEMARLHFENYEFQRTKADNATATVYQFHYAMKDAGWHPGRTDDDLTEIIRAKGRQLAQLSARQAAPNPWQQAIDHELVCLHLGVAGEATEESAKEALKELIQCHVEIAINPQTNGGLSLQPHTETQASPDGQWKCGNEYLPYHPDASHVDPAYRDGWNDCYRAAPPSHEREPRTHEWHHNSRVESATGIRDALSGMGVYLTITTILQLVDITRKAHGIGATNG